MKKLIIIILVCISISTQCQFLLGSATNSNKILGTFGLAMPVGSTSQRSSAPTLATLRYNSDSSALEVYNGSAFTILIGKYLNGSASTASAAFNIQTIGSTGYGSLMRLNSTSITGGRIWSLSSGGDQDSHGAGSFAIFDETAGLPRFKISAAGAVTYGNGSSSYTFPSARASAGQVLTDVSGDGSLSWQTPSGGGNGIYSGSGSLSTNTTVSGNSHSLTLGASDKLSTLTTNVSGAATYNSDSHTFNDGGGHSFGMNSAGFFSIAGSLNLKVERATDADLSMATSSCIMILPAITANRTLSLPLTAREGMIYIIVNLNTSGNTWQFGGGGSLVNQSDASVTSFTNSTTYIIAGDNTANKYRIISSN